MAWRPAINYRHPLYNNVSEGGCVPFPLLNGPDAAVARVGLRPLVGIVFDDNFAMRDVPSK
jgi:hypothetical protein